MSQTRIALITDGRHRELDDASARLRAVSLHHPYDLEPLEYVVSGAATSIDGRRAVWGLRARLIEDEIAAIHVLSPGVAAIAARWLSAGLQLPLIATYGGAAEYATPAHGGLSAIVRRYERWFYKGCARVVVSSELVHEDLVRERWASSEELVVARAGVHAGLFSPNKRSSELRDTWQVSDRRPAILCTGVPSPRGIELLARFRRILEDYRRPHRFVVCGARGHREAWQGATPDAAFIDDREDLLSSPRFSRRAICSCPPVKHHIPIPAPRC